VNAVLITGGSGFVGSYCVAQLLAAGYQVRATLRSLNREPEVRAMLQKAGVDPVNRLSFVAADLENDDGWPAAVAGCDYVLHVASPFPSGAPRHENELIVPAREGTLRVLRAARNTNVRRVVLTSSFAAIGYDHAQQGMLFDETTWTDIRGDDVDAYVKSKTLAERAAWEFIANEGGGVELSTINPVGIFGPVLGPDFSSSIAIVKRLLEGMPGCPRLYFGLVDVRDVADLHIRAMTHPAACGQRFLAVAGEPMSMLGVGKVLRDRLRAAAGKVPTRQLPDLVVRLGAIIDPQLRPMKVNVA
jgi:nucleoside-diphosphate-sugar epimerase